MNNQVILVLNCGSSSVKFAVIDSKNKQTRLLGLAERLGESAASITFKQGDKKTQYPIANARHDKALQTIVEKLEKQPYQLIAIGHRIVHGGELFTRSCLIDNKVLAAITACSTLAPLHNPANIAGVKAAQKAYPDLPQVAVFDTAFHQSIKEENFLYALPYAYYRQYGVRRYGFHGTSFRYIKHALEQYYPDNLPQKLIVAHLGNGASVCAIKDGQSLATSLGLTPLDGLVQGTRSGAIDPALITFLAEKTGKTADTITDELWKKSGLLGLSEQTNDCRELEAKAQDGDIACQRALSVFINKIKEFIGSYAAIMNGVDALVFTGGIGENSAYVRQNTLNTLGYLGFYLCDDKNRHTVAGQADNIATQSSRPVWVIPTNEEAMICKDTLKLLENN